MSEQASCLLIAIRSAQRSGGALKGRGGATEQPFHFDPLGFVCSAQVKVASRHSPPKQKGKQPDRARWLAGR